MFKEVTDWVSGACGFRPATEKLTYALEKRKHLREQTHLQKYVGHLQPCAQKLFLLFHCD